MMRSMQDMDDPFEANITAILADRKKVAQIIISERQITTTEAPEPDPDERLPYEISKIQQKLKQFEFEKNKKALKKQTSIVYK